MSLSLQADTTNIQEDISIKFKTNSITDKDNMEETKAIVKEEIQVALKKLEEY